MWSQNPGLKKNLYKLKESEQQLRENRTLKENITKLKEAERKFRDNPTVKKNLSKLKDAEKKFREDAKNKQVVFRCYPSISDGCTEKCGTTVRSWGSTLQTGMTRIWCTAAAPPTSANCSSCKHQHAATVFFLEHRCLAT